MFKLPENLRVSSSPFCEHGGVFSIPAKGKLRAMNVIASNGIDCHPAWEHVSVTLKTKNLTTKTANRYELFYVKSLFWDDEDVVVQFHVSASKKINSHPGCLHLWRCPARPQILPPDVLV